MEKVKKVMFGIGMVVVMGVLVPLSVYAADYYPDPNVSGSIMTAINAARGSTDTPHTIHLSGTYTEFASTADLSAFSINIDGLTFDGGGTAVWNSPAGNGACLFAGTTDNMVIKGINFVSTTNGNQMLQLIDSDNAKVENCTFTGGGMGSLAVVQSWAWVLKPGYTFEVSGCTMSNLGAGIQAWACVKGTVKDNTIDLLPGSFPGIWLGAPHAAYAAVAGNDVVDGNDVSGSGSGWPGIMLQTRPKATVSDNYVMGFDWGVGTGDSNEPTVTGNELVGNNNGIYVALVDNATITYNDVVYAGTSGIMADRVNGSSISDNTINSIGSGFSMYLAGTQDMNITRNKLGGNASWGMYLTGGGIYPGDGVSITYNVVHHPNGVGIQSWNTGGTNLNIIKNNTTFGTTNPGREGIMLIGIQNMDIRDNIVANHNYGIYIQSPAGTWTADYNASWLTRAGWYGGSYVLNTHDLERDAADPKFVSMDPASPCFLYLSAATPASILTGSSGGSFRGALPLCCIQGDEALLAACIAGRDLVMVTQGWDQPRNDGKGKGQGVKLNMPLIAHTASAYVDSLNICDPDDAEELHSCIVSYFASGGKSSHFGEQ